MLTATLLGTGVLGVSVVAIGCWGFYEQLAGNLPSVAALQHYHPPVVSRLYTGDDRLMAELAHEKRIYVPGNAIPPLVKNAFIAAEDQHFYTHGGVDFLAIGRAGLTDLFNRHGKRPLGASTITQQVAKVILLNNSSLSLLRKAREALLAMRIEDTLPKSRILEIYLNGIYLGSGAYGVEAASQTFFNKPLDQLDAAEAATLAALPKSPTNYNPYLHPKTALWRRNWVLDRMVETHAITPEQAEAAKQEPLSLRSRKRSGPLPDSEWFAEDVRRELISRYGEDQALQGGLDVHTSLDPHLQHITTQALREGLIRYDRSHSSWRGAAGTLPAAALSSGDTAADALMPAGSGAQGTDQALPDWALQLAQAKPPTSMLRSWRLAVVLSTAGSVRVGWLENPLDPADLAPRTGTLRSVDVGWARRTHPLRKGQLIMIEPEAAGQARLEQTPQVEGAAVIMDARTGRVLAMSGGWSFHQSQFNRASQALRQPGSSFKPLVYLDAMQHDISPSQTFLDAAVSYGSWHPQNYEHDNWGPTTLHDALRESRNLVTIRLAAYLGMKSLCEMAEKSGMVDKMPPYLPAALGAVETTVLREAGAYAAIANGGHVVKPSLIDYIQDPEGTVIWRPEGLALSPEGTTQDGQAGLPAVVDTRPALASPQSAYQVVTMMRAVMEHGTGMSAAAGIDRPLAGKTGTSQDYKDAWFAGFSPDLVTVVWVGYDAPRTLGRHETGARVAAPIWNQIMKEALATRPKLDFAAPEGVVLRRTSTGRIPAIDAFKPGQVPGVSANLHGHGAGTRELTASDTGADAIPLSEDSMDGPQSTGTGTSAGAAQQGAGTSSARTPEGGGDIGVGGLY
ncbi:penicillin-binding protein 1A [Oecophyllibacter saccharovorans]|uniref:penicillin-binding protein 1A n=1 Tax=Oecophyllibacter saccharovorans TaxID=2558360 RepID=UPI00116D7ABE|nr:PBP1A family penicillin-binding protein [Oecophyllibacter saccharovorans]TPW35392.1 PBP1A family penicillin-binding protein [Oecophyllibacter saccharovorans]